MTAFIFFLLNFMLIGPPVQETGGDLPDADQFVERVQDNLKSDRLLLSHYTYNLLETKYKSSGDGRTEADEVNEYEVYPSLDEEYTYRKHISKNGRRLDPEDIDLATAVLILSEQWNDNVSGKEYLRKLDNPQIRVFLQEQNQGKGSAVRRGIAEASQRCYQC